MFPHSRSSEAGAVSGGLAGLHKHRPGTYIQRSEPRNKTTGIVTTTQ